MGWRGCLGRVSDCVGLEVEWMWEGGSGIGGIRVERERRDGGLKGRIAVEGVRSGGNVGKYVDMFIIDVGLRSGI